MSFRKFRWSQVYESSEEELVALLKARKIAGERVHIDAGDEQAKQQIEKSSTVWCAEGSLTADIDGASVSLQPGDAVRIDAKSTYSVHAGIAGCAFYITR